MTNDAACLNHSILKLITSFSNEDKLKGNTEEYVIALHISTLLTIQQQILSKVVEVQLV